MARSLRFLSVLLVLLVLLTLAGCQTSTVPLDYQARVDEINFELIRQSQPVVVVGTFTDGRGTDSLEYATVRGGFGNPLKVVSSPEPLENVIRDALTAGLKLHGLLSETDRGRVLVSGKLTHLYTNTYMTVDTKISLDLMVSDFETGTVRFSDAFVIERSEEPPGGVGIQFSAADMKLFTEVALTDLINQIISDPRFAEAIR